MSKLKPCPFCGAKVTIEETLSSGASVYHAPSEECILVTKTTGIFVSPSVDRWNTRAPEADAERIRNDALRARCIELEKVLEEAKQTILDCMAFVPVGSRIKIAAHVAYTKISELQSNDRSL